MQLTKTSGAGCSPETGAGSKAYPAPTQAVPGLVQSSARPGAFHWSKALHHRVAAAIYEARRGRITQDELADRTSQVGYPITRSMIANYENGRRQSMDIAELIALAAALGVSPLSLLYPDQPNKLIEGLPGKTVTTMYAAERFVGSRLDWWPSDEIAALIDRLHALQAGVGGRGALSAKAESEGSV